MNLKAIRKRKKMSMETLAERTGIRIGTLYSYQCGKRKPDIKGLILIADALESTVDELIREKPKGGKAWSGLS